MKFHVNQLFEKEIWITLNEFFPRKNYNVMNFTGYCINENQFANGFTLYDYFIWMVPITRLSKILSLTNENFSFHSKHFTSPTEALKFFGIVVLTTHVS